MHTTFSARMAHELLCLQETIDSALTTYTGRSIVPASEVVDLLLDLRCHWLEVVMSEACEHHG
jgi:hypothetical protein